MSNLAFAAGVFLALLGIAGCFILSWRGFMKLFDGLFRRDKRGVAWGVALIFAAVLSGWAGLGFMLLLPL